MNECAYCNGFGHHVINDDYEECQMCAGTGNETYDDDRLESMSDEE
jgi:RecJ-like exonuclease